MFITIKSSLDRTGISKKVNTCLTQTIQLEELLFRLVIVVAVVPAVVGAMTQRRANNPTFFFGA